MDWPYKSNSTYMRKIDCTMLKHFNYVVIVKELEGRLEVICWDATSRMDGAMYVQGGWSMWSDSWVG